MKSPILERIKVKRLLWVSIVLSAFQMRAVDKESLKGIPVAYGMHIASSYGHEIGHAIIPVMYGDKVKIQVRPSGSGSMSIISRSMFSRPNMPHSLRPVMCALGPVGGIATTFAILKGLKAYQAYKDGEEKTGKSLAQNPFVKLAAEASLFINALNLTRLQGAYSDGHQITDHFNLRGTRAVLARGSMAATALGISFYILNKMSHGVAV